MSAEARIVIDPELASAVSARIFQIVPDARLIFSADDLSTLNGADIERLMMAAFLMGYGEGFHDVEDFRAGRDDSEILAWAARHP